MEELHVKAIIYHFQEILEIYSGWLNSQIDECGSLEIV